MNRVIHILPCWRLLTGDLVEDIQRNFTVFFVNPIYLLSNIKHGHPIWESDKITTQARIQRMILNTIFLEILRGDYIAAVCQSSHDDKYLHTHVIICATHIKIVLRRICLAL